MQRIQTATRHAAAGIAVFSILFFFAGCAAIQPAAGSDRAYTSSIGSNRTASTDAGSDISGAKPPRRPRSSVTEPKRLLVVEGALSLIGKNAIVVKGKTFPNDCTGVVRAAYWYAGIDLAKDFSKYTGNGVTRIYKTLKAKNLLYITNTPVPGDIIFWDNSYDRNEDGEWNDPLTHTGIVVSVSDDGQIEYVHANYRKGIVIEYMNLADPDTNTKKVKGKIVFINSAMRMRGQIVNELWLSSHLLREFGQGYLIR